MNKAYETLEKQVWHLSNHTSGCETDAALELNKLTKKLKYFDVVGNIITMLYHSNRGRPKENAEPAGYQYKISASIISSLEKVRSHMSSLGRFILATNILDKNKLSNEDHLPNQLGKPIQNPTSQWIFSIMALIRVIEINQSGKLQWIITNIHPLHQKIISFFGNNAKRIYDVPIALQPEDVLLNQKNWLAWCGM
jgi:hypothetical protein